MTKKILMALAAIATLTLSFSSCKKENGNGGGGKTKPQSEIRLMVDPSSFSLIVGQTQQLKVTIEPADTKYTFESANAEIATVDDKGLVTAVKKGETVIKVKAGSETKEAKVTVTPKVDVDESRYIGKDDEIQVNSEKLKASPIYIPKYEDMKGLDVIKVANEAHGWIYNAEQAQYGHIFDAPNDGEVYTDNRYISTLQYVHSPSDDIPFMRFYTKFSGLKQNILETEDGVKLVKALLACYGFTEDVKVDKFKDGSPYISAKNLFLGNSEPLIALGLCKDQKGAYSIQFEVVHAKAIKHQTLEARSDLLLPTMR